MTRYESDPPDGSVMHWYDGQPCSQCGKPLMATTHLFEGNGKRWEYRAPLYHNVQKNVGFCGPVCVMDWVKVDYVRLDTAVDQCA